jgi:hypothetical protein
MTLVDEEFWWWRDPLGYEIKKGRPGSTDPDASLLSRIDGEDTIVPLGTLERYLVSAEGLYAEFANIERPDELASELPKLLDFCKKHGVPTDPARPAFVSDVIKRARLFRQLKDTMHRNTLPIDLDQIFTRFRRTLFVDDLGNLRLRAAPDSLLDFMLDQAIKDSKRGLVFLICARCETYFIGGSGAERRADSIYCTDKCRESAKGKRKKKPRRPVD